MASASGLSRRRGAGGAGLARTSSSSDSPPSTHAGSAFTGGSKIAYDPRDLPPDSTSTSSSSYRDSSSRLPRLTIMEEILLLGLKDKQGYLSFWNDNISYALRGCILIELALRRRIAVVRDPSASFGGGRRRMGLTERLVEVVDERMTGETILDETLRMMKATQDPPVGVGLGGAGASSGGSLWSSSGSWTSNTSSATATATTTSTTGEKLSISTWVDLLSGETWNVLKIGFQLKQVRERLAKGLVDKGVLRTEKRNFLLFDMATHPVADPGVKASLIKRLVALLTSTTSSVPSAALLEEGIECRIIRAVCLVCAAYTASVLDGAMGGAIGSSTTPSIPALGYEEREAAFSRADEILGEFSVWPWGASEIGSTPASRKRSSLSTSRIATGSPSDPGRESVLGLVSEARKEMAAIAAVGQGKEKGDRLPGLSDDGEDLCLELVAGVLEVLSRLDSLL